MFGSLTSPKRQRVNTLRLIHSLALRACILNGSSEHGAVQLGHEEKLKLARFTAGELFYARHIRALGFRKPKTANRKRPAFYFPVISNAVAMASTSSFSRAAACKVSRRLAFTQ